jgi:hypothetical protein
MTTADIPALIEKTHAVMLETLKEMSKVPAANLTASPLLSGGKPITYDAVEDDAATTTATANTADQKAVEAVVGGLSDIMDGAELLDDDATEVATEADAATEVGSTTKTSPKSDKLTIA